MDAFDTSSFDAERGAFPVGDAQPVAGHSLTADLYRVKLYGKWHFLKKLKPELAGNPAYIAAFEKEFDIGFNLDHPNIVRYVSVGDDGTAPYLLTQYVDGLTLAEFVSKNPGYFKNKAHFRAFVAQVLSAVGYMHSRQVLHLDLKPGNVMLTNVDRQVKIVTSASLTATFTSTTRRAIRPLLPLRSSWQGERRALGLTSTPSHGCACSRILTGRAALPTCRWRGAVCLAGVLLTSLNAGSRRWTMLRS